MENTPRSLRPQIVLVGKTNVGKSSLVNALTNQAVSLVAEEPGTTTDPVTKAMELLPFGPVNLVDTAGYEDKSHLGVDRQKLTDERLATADLVLLVVDGSQVLDSWEKDFVKKLKGLSSGIIGVINKVDSEVYPTTEAYREFFANEDIPFVDISASSRRGIPDLMSLIVKNLPECWFSQGMLEGLIKQGDLVVLVTPIDDSAPKGRIILPQVQVLREVLDYQGLALVLQTEELQKAFQVLQVRPKLVITDSQAFKRVSELVPEEIPLTSFSLILANYKGDIEMSLKGLKKLEELPNGSKVLIAEGCTHHRQKQDIAQIQIPELIQKHKNKQFEYTWTSGAGFPKELSEYSLIIHCGGCMLTKREMLARISLAGNKDIPVINFGFLLANLHGVLDRAIKPLIRVLGED